MMFLRVIRNILAIVVTLLLVIFAIAEATSWTPVIWWTVLFLIPAYFYRPIGWAAGRIWAGTDGIVDRWERYMKRITPEFSPAIDPSVVEMISDELYLPFTDHAGPEARAAIRALIWDRGQVVERDDLSWQAARDADATVRGHRATDPIYIRLRGSRVLIVTAVLPGGSRVLLDAWSIGSYATFDVPQRHVDHAVAHVPEILAAERDGRRPQRHRRTKARVWLIVGVAAFIFIVASFFT